MANLDSTLHGIVYLITNSVNGKQYVGQTVQLLSVRFQQHCATRGKCRALESAVKKYGVDQFSVVEVAQAFSQEELNAIEVKLINELGTIAPRGYNLRSGGGQIGAMHAETKALLSAGASTPKRRAFLREVNRRPEVKEKLRAHSKANWAACSAKVIAGGARPEVQARRVASVRKAWTDPELLKRQRLHLANIAECPEAQEAKRLGLIRSWADTGQEARTQRGKNISASLIGHKKKIDYSPEAQDRRQKVKDKLWSDPDFRARFIAASRTPEVVKKRGDAIRAGWARRRERLAAEKAQTE